MTETLSLPSDVNALAPEACQFVFADGRRCRMLRWKTGSDFCPFHSREQEPLLTLDKVAAQLVPPSGEFKTANDINHLLGQIFLLVAKNQIARRDAALLARLGQLLLQSLPQVNSEIKEVFGYPEWRDSVQDALFRTAPPEVAQNEHFQKNVSATSLKSTLPKQTT